MEQFIRTNDDGNTVLDYSELDMAARINFREEIERWAADIEVDVVSEPDASNAERISAIEDTVNHEMRIALQLLNDVSGEEVEADEDTANIVKGWMVSVLASKYDIELS